ncbi:acyltransferase family protein [Chitinophaga sancti]|nr:acyltransferase [Chitinophaga sancti]WQD59585.1 acyltransferase [Chitinophaga sancti]WQG88281.1 acyltransferase [Chitinophaga sancti]
MISPSEFAIFPVITVCLISLFLINKFVKIAPRTKGDLPLDGLRGYMALTVFLHHAALYCNLLVNGHWSVENMSAFVQFGQTSVFIFFMITGFIFFSKLIDATNKTIDWQKYYVARFLRIYPLYVIVLIMILVIIGKLSNWTLFPPFSDRIMEVIFWLFFSQTTLNDYQYAPTITSAVLWSLSREWQFYALFPLLGAVFLHIKISLKLILFSILLLLLFFIMNIPGDKMATIETNSPFLVGIFAAFLVRNKHIRQIGSKKIVALFVLLMIVFSYTYYHTIFSFFPYSLISISFIAIASGNSLFGILTNYISLILGQISYSIYLIHPVLLFVVYHMFPQIIQLVSSSQQSFWIVTSIVGALLMVICSLSFRFIEKPFIEMGSKVSNRITQIKSVSSQTT